MFGMGTGVSLSLWAPRWLRLMKQTRWFFSSRRAKNVIFARAALFLSLRYVYRDVAQLVARTAGGGEAAGSSPVIPTIQTEII